MGIHPQLPTPAMRSVIKSPMRTVVVLLIDRFPQVVRAMWVLGLTYLLRRIAGLAEIPIPEPRCQLIALDHEDRGGADEELTAIVIGHPGDGICNHFGLVDRWHRLCLLWQGALHPAELGGVDGWGVLPLDTCCGFFR